MTLRLENKRSSIEIRPVCTPAGGDTGGRLLPAMQRGRADGALGHRHMAAPPASLLQTVTQLHPRPPVMVALQAHGREKWSAQNIADMELTKVRALPY